VRVGCFDRYVGGCQLSVGRVEIRLSGAPDQQYSNHNQAIRKFHLLPPSPAVVRRHRPPSIPEPARRHCHLSLIRPSRTAQLVRHRTQGAAMAELSIIRAMWYRPIAVLGLLILGAGCAHVSVPVARPPQSASTSAPGSHPTPEAPA